MVKGPRHGRLDPAVRVGAQQLDVAHRDGLPPPDRPAMRGTRIGRPMRLMAVPGFVDIDAIEGGGE